MTAHAFINPLVCFFLAEDESYKLTDVVESRVARKESMK